MSATNSGGGKANRRGKDQEMAADLKKRGVTRNTMRCPITGRIVSFKTFEQNIAAANF